MSAPISGPRLTEQIGALVDQYIKAGGRIERLPGPTLKPLPARRHPQPKVSSKPAYSRRALTISSFKRYEEAFPEASRLFDTGMPIKHIAQHLSRSEGFILRCLEHYGIDAPAVRAEQKEKALAETIEQIKIMAADGHSMRYVAEQLGISTSRVRYQADRYGIQFKGAAT